MGGEGEMLKWVNLWYKHVRSAKMECLFKWLVMLNCHYYCIHYITFVTLEIDAQHSLFCAVFEIKEKSWIINVCESWCSWWVGAVILEFSTGKIKSIWNKLVLSNFKPSLHSSFNLGFIQTFCTFSRFFQPSAFCFTVNAESVAYAVTLTPRYSTLCKSSST